MRPFLLLLLLLGLAVGCPTGGTDDDDAADDDDDAADDDDATTDDDDATTDDDDATTDDDDATADDDDSAQAWPGPGPEGSVVAEVRQFIEEEHGGDDDDSAVNLGAPVQGLVVTEVGTSNTATTSAAGVFTLVMQDYEPARIRLQVTDDVPRLLIITEDAYRAVAREVEIAASEAGHEDDLYAELYGGARDASLGTVEVTFEAFEDADVTGATATLTGSALGARVFSGADTTSPGNTLQAGNEPVVLFGNVSPGDQPLTITSPSGLQCHAPSQVLVEANTVSHVQVGCAP
jgi:hypothetical protein